MKPHPSVRIEILEDRIAPAGLVTVAYTAATGELTLTGDALNNVFSVFQTGLDSYRIEGTLTSIASPGDSFLDIGKLTKLTIIGGAGNDFIDLENLRTLTKLSFQGEAGDDDVDITNLAVNGSVTLDGGTGDDSVEFETGVALISRNLKVTDSAGGMDVEISGSKAVIGGRIEFTGSLGNDNLTVADNVSLLVAQGIKFTGNGGENGIDLDGYRVAIGRLATGQSILFTGGNLSDSITGESSNISLTGGIEFIGGEGENEVDFDDDGTVQIGRIASGQSILFTGGAGLDSIFLGGTVTAKGSVEFDAKNGENLLDIDGVARIGKRGAISLLLEGGDGEDEIDLQDKVILAGGIKMDGFAGDDNCDLTGIDRLKVGGSLKFDGAGGNDSLSMEVVSLRVFGGIKFAGGGDADTAALAADGTISGNVELVLGSSTIEVQSASAGSLTGKPGGLTVEGSLTVHSDSNFFSPDEVSLTEVDVLQDITISMGIGQSSVTLDNIRTLGALTIDTGGGNDTVDIERFAFFGGSRFEKLATIQLGAGNDILRIGSPTPAPNPLGTPDSTRAVFHGNLTADGGTGIDSRNDIAGENGFGGATPTLNGFEITNLV